MLLSSLAQFRTEIRPKHLTGPGTHAVQLPEVLVFSIRGDVSYRNAPELRGELFEALGRPGFGRMVIELGSIDSMDTAGVAVLVETFREARRQDKEVLLCTPSDSVMKTFRLAGLSDVLEACCSSPDVTWKRLHEPVADAPR